VTIDHDLELSKYSDCATCARLTDVAGRACEAFPRGIPLAIWHGEQSHKEPIEGDGGKVWEPLPGGASHHEVLRSEIGRDLDTSSYKE
jgi:hypothetical protein